MTGRRPDGSATSDYEYELPPGRVARYPTERRDRSRLLHLPASGGPFRHLLFRDLPSLVERGDLLVLNETRVFPARLVGRKPTGARAEVLLLRPLEPAAAEGGGSLATGPARPGGEGEPVGTTIGVRRWEALVRPGGKLKPGRRIVVAPGELEVAVEGPAPGGGRVVRIESTLPVSEALDRYGRIPLPPYLERADEPVDRERYQTVYARESGSVAAPTAGLHFTPDLLAAMEDVGVRLGRLTLHVGVGTFRPVDEEDPARHELHREPYRISGELAGAVRATRARGGRVWAVGTTVVRALESAADRRGEVRPGHGETALFIRPPYEFRVVDALVTNFHLPRSTLLMLVAAFAGYQRTMDAYREAVREGYRFYSYGDAMAVARARRTPG